MIVRFLLAGMLMLSFCFGLLVLIYQGNENNYATQEQLQNIVRETPCAKRGLREALTFQEGGASEPLTLGAAKKIASACKEDSGNINQLKVYQLKALNDM
ncbi:hypothetical protein [Klebsiella aerogenes]|uniref:hypothetical protein n=1 Tax=Klebsiella aerogenes TaxID=548 RepID=UPI00063C2B4D|nr:hypothetical protein [Klebsiella aerogenes]KLE98178.1 hypothetical protein YA24_17895 [Klebsiella aerogenes]